MTYNTKADKVLKMFSSSVIEFFDILIKKFPNDNKLIIMRVLFKQIPNTTIMNNFEKYVLPHKEEIWEKNEKFFLENDEIFGPINNKNDVLHFKNLWTSNSLDDDDRETIWLWFRTFINLVEKYMEYNA